MAGGEHQAQQVVADVVGARLGQGVDEVRLDVRLQRLQVGAELLVLARMQRLLAQAIEGAVLRRAHQPGARVVRHAVLRPVLERGDERVLGQLLGQADVAHHSRDAGDHLGLLDPPDRIDRAVRRLEGGHRCGCVGGGRRHGSAAQAQQGPTWRTSTVHHSRRRALGGQGQRLVQGGDVDQEEAADHLLGLGERPVEDPRLAVAHLQPRALLEPGERFDAAQEATLLQGLGEAEHAVVDELARLDPALLALPDGLHQHQHVGHATSLPNRRRRPRGAGLCRPA